MEKENELKEITANLKLIRNHSFYEYLKLENKYNKITDERKNIEDELCEISYSQTDNLRRLVLELIVTTASCFAIFKNELAYVFVLISVLIFIIDLINYVKEYKSFLKTYDKLDDIDLKLEKINIDSTNIMKNVKIIDNIIDESDKVIKSNDSDKIMKYTYEIKEKLSI